MQCNNNIHHNVNLRRSFYIRRTVDDALRIVRTCRTDSAGTDRQKLTKATIVDPEGAVDSNHRR